MPYFLATGSNAFMLASVISILETPVFCFIRCFRVCLPLYTCSYTVTLESEAAAKAFAADFDGICNGEKVTVTTKQSLEEIFMNYYGGEKND